jgi:hypothetical protein
VADTVTASGGTDNGTYNSATKELSVETNLGGKFVINILDGQYNYTASGDQTGVSETINYIIADNDEDVSNSGVLTLNIEAPVVGTPTIYTDTSAADQEVNNNLYNDTITTDTGDDWVHVTWIYNNSTLNTDAGEDLISTHTIENSLVNTSDDDDRIYLLGDNNYEEMVQATVDMGAGNDLFYFNFDLDSGNSQVYNNSVIDMGAGNDTLVFEQNSFSDFTFTTNPNGSLQITHNTNANIDFELTNAEHIYFAESNESYDIATTAVQTGIIIDGIIEGIAYETSSGLTGYTNADGSFNYIENDTITFKIGNVILGSIEADTIENNQVFLQDIANVERTDVNDEYVENMAVLLQSFDVDGDAYNGIVITQEMHEAFSGEDFDLETISEEELVMIIEETGYEAVSEDAAMEHVQDMLEEYANIEESAFDIRVDDTMMVKSEITGVLSLSDEVTVDFSQISEDVSSLEKIDLTSANVQVISLNLSDVVDLTDADNTITIIGNSSDSVSLKNENGNNWSTSNSVTENGHIFDIYSNSGDPTVTLKVEDTINDTVV